MKKPKVAAAPTQPQETDMTLTHDEIAALVARLRDEQPATQDMNHTVQCGVMEEAAAALTALQARAAELEGQDAMIGAAADVADARPPMTLELATVAERDMWRDRAQAAERRVTELEGALPTERVQHIKRGATYQIIARGRLQTDTPLSDYAALVAYRCEETGDVWFRPQAEFTPDRFAVLPPASATED